MITWLPFADFNKSVRCLSTSHLIKQHCDCTTLYTIIENLELYQDSSWRDHPYVKFWQDYVPALKAYHNCVMDEWHFRQLKTAHKYHPIPEWFQLPPQICNEDFHANHRRRLLRKDFKFYAEYEWYRITPAILSEPIRCV